MNDTLSKPLHSPSGAGMMKVALKQSARNPIGTV
jgi:hypothetical protein